MKCLWGRCKNPMTDGSPGSLCETSTDCQPGSCCAREHGVSICKNLLKEGERCEISDGGLVFSLHHNCPCVKGLRCKVTRIPR
jgi:hypothetical protein